MRGPQRCFILEPTHSDTIVVTVEQLSSTRGDVVASTVLAKAPCTNAYVCGRRIDHGGDELRELV